MELLAPGSQNTQNEPPEAHSGHIWRQAAKMLKMSLLRLILAKSDARAINTIGFVRLNRELHGFQHMML